MPVGFIGLGRMGGGMASQLLANQVAVIGCDTGEAALARFRSAGGEVVESPRAVADQAEIVFASLPSIAASRDVALGPDGIVHGGAVRIYVETSTIGPAEMRGLADALRTARDISLLDAPVSGGPKGADEGTLTTIVSGPCALKDEVEPLLKMMASHIVYAGERIGQSQIFKIVNNYIFMTSMAAMCEAIAVGVRSGLDEAALIDAVNHSTGRNLATSHFFPTLIQPRAKMSSLAMATKDVRLFCDLAEQVDRKPGCGSAILTSWEPEAEAGRSMVDWYCELVGEPTPGEPPVSG